MKIFCVGRNFKAHAAELNNEVPKQPVIFMKPETALADLSKPLVIPEFTQDLQHEIEIVLKIARKGKNLLPDEALNCFREWTVGIDFTARDLQTELKKKSLPWELAKSFDGSAVIGDFIPVSNLLEAEFYLTKNEAVVQKGKSDQMLFSFVTILCFISRYFTIEPGDLVFTGTPPGVSSVTYGDLLCGFLNKQKLFDLRMSFKEKV